VDKYRIKARLVELNKTQVWLTRELIKRGENVTDSAICKYRSGALNTPKSKRILALCDKVLKEYEREGA
jgi:hypothetical protein